MKFTRLQISNFLTIGDADLRLDGLGLVHINGENLDETSADSNGSGKSSIVDALCWALWGSTARGVGGDDVVNVTAGKGCVVSVEIDDDGDIYLVRRHRKDGKNKNALALFRHNGTDWDDITKGTAALTQKAIERLLGTSEEVFNSALYFGQESIPDIPRMTDRQLKVLVEQAAGVDVLTNAYDIARGRYRECAERRADAQVALDRALERHADSIASLQRLSDQKTQWVTQQKNKIENLKLETQAALEEYTKAKSQLSVDEEADVREGIRQAEGKIASVSEERRKEQVLAQDLAQAQASYQSATSGATLAERLAQQRLQERKEAAAALEQAEGGIGEPCVSCGRPLTEDHLKKSVDRAKNKLVKAQADLEDAALKLKEARKRLAASEVLMQKAKTDLDTHRSGMTDVSAEGVRLANLNRELQRIVAFKNEVERLRQRAQRSADEWKRESACDNPFEPMIEQENDTIIKRAEIADRLKKELAEKKEEEAYAQAVSDLYAPSGVRAHRLDEATPFLNERTAHYLGSLADGAIEAYWTTVSETKSKDKLVERFSVTIEKQGSAPNFNALSGGEKRKVRLACALALQDLVSSRAAKSIDLWVGDEVDDALDAAGLERLMGVLEEKARDRGTVLVVSHNDIAHYARQTITVTKQNGKSRVTVN